MMWNNTLYDTTKLTIELRDLVESGVNIWDFDYPSYYKDEEKKAFEQKVIDHFYFRQIGQETPARWLHYFRTRIREIMPYYLDIYKSVELFKSVEDPLESYNLTETYKESASGSGSSSDNSTSETSTTSSGHSESSINENLNNERKHSDTPQGSITNLDEYMTEGTLTKDTNTRDSSDDSTGQTEGISNVNASGTTSSESERSYELSRRGNIGVQPLGQEIKILREAYINVDMMIINELNDLFLGVY